MRAVIAIIYVLVLIAAGFVIINNLRVLTQPVDVTPAVAERVSTLLSRNGLVQVVLAEGVHIRCRGGELYVVDAYGHESRVDVGGRIVVGEDAFGVGWLAVNETHVVCNP